MKCPFCSEYHELPINKEEVEEHLVVTVDKKSHFHVHGPCSQKSLMKLFLLKIAKEAEIDIEEGRSRIKGTGGRVEEEAPNEDKIEEKRSSEGCKIYEE